MRGISLFASSGIGEFYLTNSNIDIVVANELLPKRAELYRKIYPESKMITGDITNEDVFAKIQKEALEQKVEFMIASPPCQGMSVAGKNRNIETMATDNRNYLIMYVIKMIESVKPRYIIIENVPALLKLELKVDNNFLTVPQLLELKLSRYYDIDYKVLDTADFGTPQRRKRAIIRLSSKGNPLWEWPKENPNLISVRDAIGDLPSIESGEVSDLPWHFARKHTNEQIEWMKHTPTGMSAVDNEIHYPKKKDGSRIKSYRSSYRRIKWEEPAPTITIRNDAISSQRNVHPGRIQIDGTYSDARVLSILELSRLTGLPDDWRVPLDTPEILVRQVLGECIPPRLIEALTKGII
ncbi:TPA: DNA (cytosine-5-)-methyltransferase [Streptococcus suis]|nr:DNA (cytosine-5-)-methyltransferase [Streptococcus suis]HEM3642088.1 DNA (cytosine-5-)-methyltransferase [Streptococcus suis]